MKTVKIRVKDLLAHLKTNRASHIKDYDEAMVGYRQAIRDELNSKLIIASQDLDVSHTLKTVRPSSYESSYDEAISMLEWTTDKEVELDQIEFKQYVQDEWRWKNDFVTSTAFYKA
jgi:hypothetical protein